MFGIGPSFDFAAKFGDRIGMTPNDNPNAAFNRRRIMPGFAPSNEPGTLSPPGNMSMPRPAFGYGPRQPLPGQDVTTTDMVGRYSPEQRQQMLNDALRRFGPTGNTVMTRPNNPNSWSGKPMFPVGPSEGSLSQMLANSPLRDRIRTFR